MKITGFIKQSAAVLIIAAISLAGYAGTPEGVITMTTAIEGEAKFSMSGYGEAVIDWGDGSTPDTVTYPEDTAYFYVYPPNAHTFSETTTHTIVITGKNIIQLVCDELQLTALDVTKNMTLGDLYCDNNRLTSLDLSQNTALTCLSCDSNRLTSLDVSNNTALTELDCGNNALTALDVSNNTVLEELYCRDNKLTAEGLNALFRTLHATNTDDKKIYIIGNPGADACDRSIAKGKGWRVAVY